MSLQDSMKDHQRAWTLGLILFIATVAAIIWAMNGGMSSANPRGPSNGFFLDIDDGHVFVANGALAPPLAPPGKSEASGVRVRIYACGSCRSKERQFQAYLQTVTPEAKEAKADIDDLTDPGSPDTQRKRSELQALIIDGEQVAKPEAPYTWVAAQSAEGQEVVKAGLARCEGKGTATECFP